MKQQFYFDHNATTPVSPEVLDALVSAMTNTFGNASSVHQFGQAARQSLEAARRSIAAWICADPAEIVFTSGGTESDNLALFGAVRASGRNRPHVITTAIEHPAVLNTCSQLEREGCAVTYVRVGTDCTVDPDDIRQALRSETVAISVMHANNETGTIQPVAEIARIAREAGVLMHSDGVQAAGKIPVSVRDLGLDLYSISGHKVHAPKGVGVLYVRKGTKISALQFGGHHERDRRAGTENVPGAVALGRAADWLKANQASESARIANLRDRFERALATDLPWARVNCLHSNRLPNTSSVLFEGVESEPMLIALDLKGFAVSSGAACSSGAVEPSHVLTAIGLSREEARSCLRISFGRGNDDAQTGALVSAVIAAASHLKRIAPAHA